MESTAQTPEQPPMGWTTTRTGKTYHHFGATYQEGKPKAFCHWGLIPAPGIVLAKELTGQPIVCPTCLARYQSWKKGDQPTHWTQPKQEEPPVPTALASGVRVEITARSHKGQYGTVTTEDDDYPGFWWVEVTRNGKGKEWMFSAGQLVIKK